MINEYISRLLKQEKKALKCKRNIILETDIKKSSCLHTILSVRSVSSACMGHLSS